MFMGFAGTAAAAGTPSELHITPDGAFSAKNVVVMQKAGTSNFFCRVTWGNAFVRVTVLAHDSTAITKNHGEAATSNDIQEGDILDVTGVLFSGDGSFVVDATRIRDTSLEQESKTIAGTVQSINAAQSSFVLPNKTFGSTTVTLAATTTIQKGARTIQAGDIAPGDKILSASGVYDFRTNTLAASSVNVYQDKTVFSSRNFQGTLKNLTGTSLPAALTVTVENTDYTVYLSAQASVLSKNKGAANLSRFVAGDTVRFYGAIRQTALTEVDAIIVRDLNF